MSATTKLISSLVADHNHAQVGLQSGEGIVGNFGAGRGDARNQRGLADIGISDQAHVGQKFEFEAEYALFAGPTFFVFAGSLMGGGCEAGIAAAAAPAVGDDDALVGPGKVPDFLAGLLVVDDGADRDFQQNIHAFASGFVRAFAVASALRFVFRVEAEMDERVVALAGFHDDIATLAAVAAGRAAARDEFLPAEGEAAIAAVAGFDSDCGFIDEHWSLVLVVGRWRNSLAEIRRGARLGSLHNSSITLAESGN